MCQLIFLTSVFTSQIYFPFHHVQILSLLCQTRHPPHCTPVCLSVLLPFLAVRRVSDRPDSYSAGYLGISLITMFAKPTYSVQSLLRNRTIGGQCICPWNSTFLIRLSSYYNSNYFKLTILSVLFTLRTERMYMT